MMASDTESVAAILPFLRVRDGLILHQSLYAVAKLGVADLLRDGPRSTSELANRLQVDESALHRVLRVLASHGIFEETAPRVIANNASSNHLCTGVPGSVRSMVIFWGTDFYYRSFGEILYSIQTGEAARSKVLGTGVWEYLEHNPEAARIFDDAMTDFSAILGPTIAAAYDFGIWGSIMDVVGGNGILLASILKAHSRLRGVLADLPHVLERAKERAFLAGELEARSGMQACDFFREVPSGCRAYVLKSVIHDWDDEHAHAILANCRRAVPADGALLIVEWALREGDLPAAGKQMDVVMLLMTGGKERTVEEHRKLLAGAGFRLNRVATTSTDLNIFEALPD